MKNLNFFLSLLLITYIYIYIYYITKTDIIKNIMYYVLCIKYCIISIKYYVLNRLAKLCILYYVL